jgi:ABC-2 type transport system permease protein
MAVGVGLGLVVAAVLGAVIGGGLAVAGHRAPDPEAIFVIATAMICLAVIGIGVVVGLTQPVDPRVVATEPLSPIELSVGLLAAAAAGPPGLSAGLVGIGLVIGATRGPAGGVVVVLTVAVWLVTLLLVSRSTVNVLGLLATRFPRAGQFVVGIGGLVAYGGFQIVPRVLNSLDESDRADLAEKLSFTPMGQLGRALGAARDEPLAAIGHLALGTLWLPALLWAYAVSTQRLLVSVRGARTPETATRRRRPTLRRLATAVCGRGPAGAIARRCLATRLRTPRTALETVIAIGIGGAAVVIPALASDAPAVAAVLVGGAVQLSVIFMAGNVLGNDGPAVAGELLTGVDPAHVSAGVARSVLLAASPLVVAGPPVAAAITGEWRFLGAAYLVAVGGLLAGAGGALAQSSLVPFPVPPSDNPLAGGEAGRGCLAGLMLFAVLVGLALVTLPIALLLLWAVDRDSVVVAVLAASATVVAGALLLRAGRAIASHRLARREPEMLAAITPSR